MTRDPNENGWQASAAAWIASQNQNGDFARNFVLDTPMLERVRQSGAKTALDVGCGEGRFCRMMQTQGIKTTGLDPVPAMLDRASELDIKGDYHQGFAEDIPFEDSQFDLAVMYLSLIDIDDYRTAIDEAFRVLKPGGRLLVGNLSSFSTSNDNGDWITGNDGKPYFPMGPYLEERSTWVGWLDIRVRNWHRPLCAYMQAFLQSGFVLTHFDEPKPTGGPEGKQKRYEINAYLMIMEWEKLA